VSLRATSSSGRVLVDFRRAPLRRRAVLRGRGSRIRRPDLRRSHRRPVPSPRGWAHTPYFSWAAWSGVETRVGPPPAAQILPALTSFTPLAADLLERQQGGLAIPPESGAARLGLLVLHFA
jgi:hypothetical protein